MTITKINKKKIVKEILDIMHDWCREDMAFGANRAVCLYLKDNYGMDRSEATELIIGAELIDELGLLK